MYRPLALTSMVHNEPDKARAAIVAAFKRAKCSRQDTAIKMKVSKRSLARWIDLLGMDAELEKIENRAIRDGWHHGKLGGHPLGTKNKPRKAA